MTVLFLHPGMMGASLAAACRETACWVSTGRSQATVARAQSAGLDDAVNLDAGIAAASVVVSICPPAAAVEVADQVAKRGFGGIYVDANAISPATAQIIAARFDRFVDGSVIGPPAWSPGTTRLYLSGNDPAATAEVGALWQSSPVDARVIDGGAGAASALKMAYASWTKIGSALLLAVRGLAAEAGVEAPLLDEWTLSQPGLVERSERTATGVGPKAWRFVGEMEQIASSFSAADLPPGFAEAAAEIYARLAPLQGDPTPVWAQVADLLGPPA